MDYHFTEVHQKEIGDDPAPQGFPDDGNGRYTQKKVYPEWYFMNIAKRQRNNNLEGIITMGPLSLVNGLFMPWPTMVFLNSYMVGRSYYNEGYNQKEGVRNKDRMIGAVLCHCSNIFTILTSLLIGI